jgi:hypothetical protein
MPMIFFWIWRKSKNGNQKAYLAGVIIYVIDTILCVMFKSWLGVGFHLFALIWIGVGYVTLLENKKANELENKSE